MAKVNVNYRATINMGNYESLQYSVGIELECKDEDIVKTKKVLEQALEKEIIKKVKEIKKKGREHYGFETNCDEDIV
jgi:NADH:ubiquinone oxidoreductase subunit F (NADH-binding)